MTAPKYVVYQNTSWAPVMRLVEFDRDKPRGDPASDLFRSQTYEIDARPDMGPWFRWGVFIPKSIDLKAPPILTKLHIFFAPGLARVSALRHALRYFSNFHDFVLLVVPCNGDDHPIPLKGSSSPRVDDDDISTILRSLGLSINVLELHITAHSRGNNSLRESLKNKAFDLHLSKKVLNRVIMMDCLYDYVPPRLSGLVPRDSIIGYDVVEKGRHYSPGLYHRRVNLRSPSLVSALRAIGYARLFRDAQTIRGITLPPTLQYQVNAVLDGPPGPPDPLPELGYFTTPKGNTFSPGKDPVCGGKNVSLADWCSPPAGPRANRLKLLQDERPGEWSARSVLSVCDINQWLLPYWRVGEDGDLVPPRVWPTVPFPEGLVCKTYEYSGPPSIEDKWWNYDADTYSHEYVVTELWHETLAASATVMSLPAPIIR